ncbi:hypothetical protein GYA37_03185 [candidate division WWE3 bacterium]|uniref:Nucleotidyltransferase domain-containing protein n=1 Tax=candidate division WWE3 bacterium TaxID=2053526 RepID=A0A7X9E7F7_UNCKA|nr:hypothetical protein [candidate division WWE3 bacterium]
MINKENIDNLVSFINQEIIEKLGDKTEALYLVGSYASGNISLNRPDINWLLIHKDPVEDESRWVIGEIFTEAIDKFINQFVVRPELRPFKFSYPIKRGEDVFINLSIVTDAPSAQEFIHKNSFLPEYVFEGFKSSRKLVFGNDLLKNISFEVNKNNIWSLAMEKIISHKVQLDRIPLTYHLQKDVDLVYNEALSHGKNLLYFAVELLMSEEELKEKKYIEIFQDKNSMQSFLTSKYAKFSSLSQTIYDAKDNYEKFKSDKDKAKEVYLAASKIADIMFEILFAK